MITPTTISEATILFIVTLIFYAGTMWLTQRIQSKHSDKMDIKMDKVVEGQASLKEGQAVLNTKVDIMQDIMQNNLNINYELDKRIGKLEQRIA